MIGQSPRSSSILFPSQNTLYTRQQLESANRAGVDDDHGEGDTGFDQTLESMVRSGHALRVHMDNEPLFCASSPPPPPPHGSLQDSPMTRKRLRGMPKMDPRLRDLQRQLTSAQDRLRNLKLLQRSRTEHADLAALVDKWRSVCGLVLDEVRQRLREAGGDSSQMRSRKILASLGIKWDNMGLDLSSESEADPDSETLERPKANNYADYSDSSYNEN